MTINSVTTKQKVPPARSSANVMSRREISDWWRGAEEAQNYVEETARERKVFFGPIRNVDHNQVKRNGLRVATLDRYSNTEWSALNYLDEFNEETPDAEEQWLPIYFNQETELDEYKLMEWLFNLGDRADCQFDS